jgi:hypothetical protein
MFVLRADGWSSGSSKPRRLRLGGSGSDCHDDHCALSVTKGRGSNRNASTTLACQDASEVAGRRLVEMHWKSHGLSCLRASSVTWVVVGTALPCVTGCLGSSV